ncbi:alpha/beta hydrolase [Natronomonas amylolytica]|uniref:alpha/beta hydrolase n=1 Tax=Natronomonas amylolytica TaxID=3108498 RepID=UPI00300A14C9
MSDSGELPLVHESRPGSVEENAPAVVLIHGRGTNERDLLPIAAQLLDELHVLSVRAPNEMGGPNSYTWYDLDPDRVGLLGFSQGAITSMSALLERPEAYRWVVALNGYLAESHHDEVDNAEGKPVFVGCGAMDQVIPPERAEQAAELLKEGGADVRFERYGVGHGTAPQEITDVVTWLEGRY